MKTFRKRLIFAAICLMLPTQSIVAERVVGVNTYVRKVETWPLDPGGSGSVYWRQNHYGNYEMREGPMGFGTAECIGAGFGEAAGSRGEGICLYESSEGTLTMRWQARPGELTSWKITSGTGKFEGIRGEGVTRSRILSEFVALQQYESIWEGEITLPE